MKLPIRLISISISAALLVLRLPAQNCINADQLTVTPPPVNGTYPPGTTVQFCYEVTTYTRVNSNWLHGIVPLPGNGWDAGTLQPVGQPASIDGSGTWLWTSGFTSTNTGTYFPNPGWFYDSNSGGPLDGNPGNNYGDNGTGPWTFCWQITTLPANQCTPGASLNIVIQNYGDSESGSWTNTGCTADPDYVFQASSSCCDADVTFLLPDCGQNNGSITITGLTNPPWQYTVRDDQNNIIFQQSNTITTSTVQNLSSGIYSVEVIDNTGCVYSESIDLNNPGIPPFSIEATDSIVCPGSQVQLTVNFGSSNQACGAAVNNCAATQTATVGTGNSYTGSPTPYEGFWHDSRLQMLFTAAELQNMGLSAGIIDAIAFNVAVKGSTQPYNGFTIKMGCTQLGSLNSFQPLADVVYGPVSYTTTTGWNVHNFHTPYQWDGVSNLIVEICYDNTSYTDDDDVYYTSTGFTSVVYYYADNNSGCMMGTSYTSSARPNTRFTYCNMPPPSGNYQVHWSPANGLDDTTSLSPVAIVNKPVTYTVTLTDSSGCSRSASLFIDTAGLSITAGPDTFLCTPGPVPLFCNISGYQPPAGCQAASTACANTQTSQIGSGNASTTIPTPYKGFYEDNRMQLLLTAAELQSAGIQAGNITALAFNIASKNSSLPYTGFTIKMGCTTLTQLSTFQNVNTLVFGPATINTGTGWNTHTFHTPYNWDGVSNLIIEICFDNADWTSDDAVYYTATGYNSVVYSYTDGATGCLLSTASTSANRPDIRISWCPTTLSYTWTPTTGLSNPYIPDPVATPNGSISYIVTVNNGQCVVTDTVDIIVASPGGIAGLWVWTGMNNDDWHDPCNWDKFRVPTLNDAVFIPGNTTYNPVIRDTAYCKNITIDDANGGHLFIDNNSGGYLIKQP